MSRSSIPLLRLFLHSRSETRTRIQWNPQVRCFFSKSHNVFFCPAEKAGLSEIEGSRAVLIRSIKQGTGGMILLC